METFNFLNLNKVYLYHVLFTIFCLAFKETVSSLLTGTHLTELLVSYNREWRVQSGHFDPPVFEPDDNLKFHFNLFLPFLFQCPGS